MWLKTPVSCTVHVLLAFPITAEYMVKITLVIMAHLRGIERSRKSDCSLKLGLH